MELHKAVKAIRLEMGLSQQMIGREILVSFVAVNRWKNQHTKPNQIARHALAQMAKKYKIDTNLIKIFKDSR